MALSTQVETEAISHGYNGDQSRVYICHSMCCHMSDLSGSLHRANLSLDDIAHPHTPSSTAPTGGELALGAMVRMGCSCKFRVYEPFPEYRELCAKVLVICNGQHAHPIPLPTKTPAKICSQLATLLLDLDHDLPNLTPRRLLRHPVLQAFLCTSLPSHNPILSDLHTSLANKDHIRAFITEAKNDGFPAGTGWSGMCAPFERGTLLTAGERSCALEGTARSYSSSLAVSTVTHKLGSATVLCVYQNSWLGVGRSRAASFSVVCPMTMLSSQQRNHREQADRGA